MNEPNQITGLSAKEQARIEKLMEKHKDELQALSAELATNYNVPAQRLISFALARMGISRLDYEKIGAVEGNWRYEAPPKALLARWARY